MLHSAQLSLPPLRPIRINNSLPQRTLVSWHPVLDHRSGGGWLQCGASQAPAAANRQIGVGRHQHLQQLYHRKSVRGGWRDQHLEEPERWTAKGGRNGHRNHKITCQV